MQTCKFLKFLAYGFSFFLFSFSSWLWDIIIEATFEGRHTFAVQRGLRLGFILFIVSEFMFFFGFFWAFFHSSVSPSIWINAMWPPFGSKYINPNGLPLVNTCLLLISGITVTYAHKAVVLKGPNLFIGITNSRLEVIKALALTISLGLIFTLVQLYEYQGASFSINSGIYGSIFYLLTGFHGFHVLVGTIFLTICLLRHIAYHFTTDHHLGLEMAIWYWHFVDVVWIFLYIFLYIWGGPEDYDMYFTLMC